MKNYLTFLIILAFIVTTKQLNAQVEDVITGLNLPAAISIKGNDLYFTELGSPLDQIKKFDITDPDLTITEAAVGFEDPNIMLFNGDDLYIAEFNGGKITKIDVTDPDQTVTTVLDGLDTPRGLALNGNDLYIAERSPGRIIKINIALPNPTITELVTGLNGPSALLLDGDDLYIAERFSNAISKIDITETDPIVEEVVTGLNDPLALMLIEDDLYISQFDNGTISKINITEANPVAEDAITGLDGPSGLAYSGDYIYIGQYSGNKISRFQFQTTIATEKLIEQLITLFPNPASDYIQITGLAKAVDYNILNIAGVNLLKGSIVENKKIDISNLANGMYFINLSDGNHIKFAKE